METPLKRSVLDTLKKQEPIGDDTLMSVAKNPANCDAETCIVEIPPTPLRKTLGFGTGVQVMCIERQNPSDAVRSPWAIKMLSARCNPEYKALYKERLEQEAKLLRKLCHPNIVGYRGYDALGPDREFLALEYCTASLGDILEKRYANNQGPLEAAKAKRMTVHVLRGLDYLHTVAHILHGDMKSFNVLINNDFENAKICDFGVSLELDKDGMLDLQKNPDAHYIGTGIWSAPEVLENKPSLVGTKADIFSFGMVIYETLTLLPPHTFPGIKDESIVNSAGYASLRANVSVPSAKRQLDLSGIIVIDDDAEVDPEVLGVVAKRKKLLRSTQQDSTNELAFVIDDDDEPSNPTMTSTPAPAKRQETTVELPAAIAPGDAAPTVDTPTPEADTPTAPVPADTPTAPVPADTSTAPVPAAPASEEAAVVVAKDEPETTVDSMPKPAAEAVPISIYDDMPKLQSDMSIDPGLELLEPHLYPAAEVITVHSSESGDSYSEDSRETGEYVEGDYANEPIILDEEDEYYDEEEDMDGYGDDEIVDEEEDEEDEDDGPYLNYGVLGSRPPIPTGIALEAEHLPLLELYHICTEADPAKRPSARSLLDALTVMGEEGNADINSPAGADNNAPSAGAGAAEAVPAATKNDVALAAEKKTDSPGAKEALANTIPPSK